jgi:hypothetical protein
MAQRPRARAGQQAALLLGQVRGDQLVQLGQHGIDVHPATLPFQQASTATIGQTSRAGTPNWPGGRLWLAPALLREGR